MKNLSKTDGFNPADLHRLIDLVGDVADRHGCDFGAATSLIERRSLAPGEAPDRNELCAFVDGWLKLRRRRNQSLGATLFRDPAWDMLLDLFVASGRGTRLSVSALCLSSGVPMATALRHLGRLEKLGMVRRSRDPNDDRRDWVIAAAATTDRMAAICTDLFETAKLAAKAAENG